MTVEILSPDKNIWKGEAVLVQLPGVDGLFEILNKHAPLISVLRKGTIKIITPDKSTQYIQIKEGIVEVLNNNVIILTE
ncbi:MAG TPA: ATP synthase F1 subunit epsilon [Bacteroidales bacterium]|nr:ATP synthase F1 subunit epsilon [Bacteroidales bacterium]